jgi:chromosome segregation ATPase
MTISSGQTMTTASKQAHSSNPEVLSHLSAAVERLQHELRGTEDNMRSICDRASALKEAIASRREERRRMLSTIRDSKTGSLNHGSNGLARLHLARTLPFQRSMSEVPHAQVAASPTTEEASSPPFESQVSVEESPSTKSSSSTETEPETATPTVTPSPVVDTPVPLPSAPSATYSEIHTQTDSVSAQTQSTQHEELESSTKAEQKEIGVQEDRQEAPKLAAVIVPEDNQVHAQQDDSLQQNLQQLQDENAQQKREAKNLERLVYTLRNELAVHALALKLAAQRHDQTVSTMAEDREREVGSLRAHLESERAANDELRAKTTTLENQVHEMLEVMVAIARQQDSEDVRQEALVKGLRDQNAMLHQRISSI